MSFASCADVVKTWEVVGDSGIQPRHAFEAQSSAVACVCWNHNNQVLASCNRDGLIALSHFEGKLIFRTCNAAQILSEKYFWTSKILLD